jgi:hypothetical protein
VDGTNISQPASKGTDWRVHAGYDLGTGGFVHLALTDNRGAESIERGAPKPGEVRIADRNYANAGALDQWRATAANQADFIVRARWKSFVLDRPDGAPFSLPDYLAALPADSPVREVAVLARVSKTRDLPLRLIIQRNSAEVTENIRRHLRATAARRGKTLDARSLVAAEFLVLATSLPTEGYPAEEVLAAYRLRWQIELAFKRLKSLLHIDLLPTHTPAASRSWLYAHLILALLCDDLSQDFLESSP